MTNRIAAILAAFAAFVPACDVNAQSEAAANSKPSAAKIYAQGSVTAKVCAEAEFRASQSLGRVTIYAEGEHATAGYEVFFQQLPIRVWPPQYRLWHIEPTGTPANVVTPFVESTSFDAAEAVDMVIVYDAGGQNEIPVEQTAHDASDESDAHADDKAADGKVLFGEWWSPDYRFAVRGCDFVAVVKMINGVTHAPPTKRILVTDYVCTIDQVIKGQPELEDITIRNVGGELADEGMNSTHSYKLRPGQRYLVFARKLNGRHDLVHAIQVISEENILADKAGRVIVGIRDGKLLTRPNPQFDHLHYIASSPPTSLRPASNPTAGMLPGGYQRVQAGDLKNKAAMSLDTFTEYLRSTVAGECPKDIAPEPVQPDANLQLPERILWKYAGYVSSFQSYYHYIPDDDNWEWLMNCHNNWNRRVTPPDYLLKYKIDGSSNPIRNRLPVADNGRFDCGVLTDSQMEDAGYDSWTTRPAGGICYQWYTTTNGRIKEADVLINPAYSGTETYFRVIATHELGHALSLDHENRYVAVMDQGDYTPNYLSWWYSRSDDFFGIRAMLEWVNSNIGAGTWDIAEFTDMATWSQAHPNPGTNSDQVMTSISSDTVRAGDQVTFRNVHIENRGNIDATNMKISFYLSSNDNITSSDHEITWFRWDTFDGDYWHGNLDATIPSVSAGTYYVGWILTADQSEISESNNKAILRQGSVSSGGTIKTIRVRN
ncbi:zinc metalloprotease [Tautonia rosea]|uniref:hypothetical protein n=1 Tax=Tautonia rosea TaxID=2728037 RepID=UPI001475987A|nr:hypothetical protein [Tautonia rosea]